jgi:O-methyltransferase
MKRIIVFGTGSAMKDFLSVSTGKVEIVGLSDNENSRHGTMIEGHPVLSPADLNSAAFDYIVIASRAVDAIRDSLIARGVPDAKMVAFYPSFSQRLNSAANIDVERLNNELGLQIPTIGLATMYLDPAGRRPSPDLKSGDFVRDRAFLLAARQIADREIDGAIAELGVYQGDQAAILNSLFPCRPLLLFDTFEGFAEQDLSTEKTRDYSGASLGDFADTSVDLVMNKMPHPEQVSIQKGFFPNSTEGVDARFAFVSLDVDLYEPTLAGLRWFYQRLNAGGFIFVHDYNNVRYAGVKHAVDQFVQETRAASVPLPDFAGSMVIAR